MLVSSIGYFNNRNLAGKDYSVNTQIMKTNLQAGFGHVQNTTPNIQENLFSRLGEAFKALFSHEKSDTNEKIVSVIV